MNHVIIGNGIAGISTAETIRKNRPIDKITIIGNEPGSPYWRSSLTKYILDIIPMKKMNLKPENWFSDNKISQVQGNVSRINTAKKVIHYENNSKKSTLPYDKLCIATGAPPVMLNIPGNDLPEVLTFRSLKDADQIKSMLSHKKNMVIIGGGVLGLEVAEIAVKSNVNCTIIQRGNKIGTPLVDDDAAEILLKRVTGKDGVHKNGAKVIFSDEAEEFVGDKGHLKEIRLKSGSVLPCDVAVVCIGIAATPELFENAGLKFDQGLVVDEHQQTSAPDIYGAGDCVVYPNESGQLVPTRTWVTSRIQGKTAGYNMCDIPCLLFDEGPMYNASLLFDMFYTIIGEFNTAGKEYKAYSCKTDEFSYRKLTFKGNRIVGAMMLGNRNGDQAIRRLIAQNVVIPSVEDKKKLLDTAFDPNDMATQGIEYIMY